MDRFFVDSSWFRCHLFGELVEEQSPAPWTHHNFWCFFSANRKIRKPFLRSTWRVPDYLSANSEVFQTTNDQICWLLGLTCGAGRSLWWRCGTERCFRNSGGQPWPILSWSLALKKAEFWQVHWETRDIIIYQCMSLCNAISGRVVIFYCRGWLTLRTFFGSSFCRTVSSFTLSCFTIFRWGCVWVVSQVARCHFEASLGDGRTEGCLRNWVTACHRTSTEIIRSIPNFHEFPHPNELHDERLACQWDTLDIIGW